MRSPTMLLTVCCVAQAALGHAQTLAGKTAVVFATVAEGRQILAARDEFVERMSPFDRAARLKTARPVSEEEFLKHVGQERAAPGATRRSRPWSPSSRTFDRGWRRCDFPSPTRFTSSRPPATRKAAPPTPGLAPSSFPPTNSQDARLRCASWSATSCSTSSREPIPNCASGSTKPSASRSVPRSTSPPHCEARKITNPDAPRNDHYIRVRVGGKECLAVPILYADRETYDVARGGEFFDYLQFRLLLVERGKRPDSVPVLYDGDEPRLVDLQRSQPASSSRSAGIRDMSFIPKRFLPTTSRCW